ncbi:MAG: sulfotransferase, partial [Psychroserpens sp.]|nr:sulfotransferase [Psychroserpens sp.]
MTVNFLLIGAAKSATTSLSNALSQHPDICFSNPKEPEFFCKDNWRDKIENYHSLFKQKSVKLYGEGSTNYSKFPHYNKNIHKDIFDYNPNMKIIYMMRHPIDRIVSHYIHSYNRGHESINDINIEELTTDPWFVPEATTLYDQLQAFKSRREHFAVVVDEYGSFMGIVTLEDILEEIVGEIDDE